MVHGLFRTEMHCPTDEYDEVDSRNSFAHEYSIRVWDSGADVGLYSANWTGIARQSSTPKTDPAIDPRRELVGLPENS